MAAAKEPGSSRRSGNELDSTAQVIPERGREEKKEGKDETPPPPLGPNDREWGGEGERVTFSYLFLCVSACFFSSRFLNGLSCSAALLAARGTSIDCSAFLSLSPATLLYGDSERFIVFPESSARVISSRAKLYH